eukprot:320074-Pelagomonas_calceolata.AAC.1
MHTATSVGLVIACAQGVMRRRPAETALATVGAFLERKLVESRSRCLDGLRYEKHTDLCTLSASENQGALQYGERLEKRDGLHRSAMITAELRWQGLQALGHALLQDLK